MTDIDTSLNKSPPRIKKEKVKALDLLIKYLKTPRQSLRGFATEIINLLKKNLRKADTIGFELYD